MPLLVALHVMSNLVWIGSIACVGWLLAAAEARAAGSDAAGARTLAEVSAAIYRRAATPAFAVSFAAGLAQVALQPEYYLAAHWFHAKVTFALVVIALHHVIGGKSRRAAAGGVQGGGSGAILTAALLAATFGVVVFAIYKTQLVR